MYSAYLVDDEELILDDFRLKIYDILIIGEKQKS